MANYRTGNHIPLRRFGFSESWPIEYTGEYTGGRIKMAAPIRKVRKKCVELAVWNNNGEISYSIRKQYHDKKTDTWKNTTTFFIEELQNLNEMLTDEIRLVSKDDGKKTKKS